MIALEFLMASLERKAYRTGIHTPTRTCGGGSGVAAGYRTDTVRKS